MNDIVLSGLINLFALFGSDSGLSTEESLRQIDTYLKRFYGVRSPRSYLNLYSDLRGFYDFGEIDKEAIAESICTKMQANLKPSDRAAFLLRLMEFCSSRSDTFDPRNGIFVKVAGILGVDDKRYSDFIDFVGGVPGNNVLVFPLGEGTLKTILDRESGELAFSYLGDGIALMNDIPVISGVFQIWQQSGVLKGRDFSPMYYSTVLSRYDGDAAGSKQIEMCGRDIDFRFDTGGDFGMHNFSFTLHGGQLVAIMGGSGVGKSTLLSLLNGNLQPQKGSVTINGHDISEPGARKLIGFVPQDDLLIEELSVYQNLWYTAKLCFAGMPDDQLDAKVLSVLRQLGLDAARDLKVGSPVNKFISGGQRKRLNIALELIREPAILFLDEPTSGLSSTDTENVINLLKEQTGKGRLVITNIHQPSSDVYKLFDRLWVLDKGGYPVFDGNPIEAVSYFKSAANYADADTTACPVCGNVNPEVVLNIIDEKRLDNSGQISDSRKVSPQEWHELYLGHRPEMPAPERSEVPDTGQKRPGVLAQTLIFLRRNVSAKLSNLQYILVTLLEAPLLAAICAALTRYVPDGGVYSVMDNKNLVSYYFMAIIVAIFLGMAGSAEEIIRDRALLKREKFLRLSYGSYISSKIIFMAAVCAVQTLLFILVGNAIMGIHELLWFWWMVLFVSAFLSGLVGLLLSQFMNSVVAIYITIPLLLIPQILLCGLVVSFDDLNNGSETGNVPVIGDVIPSRWSFEALAVGNFTMGGYESNFFEQDRSKYTAQYYRYAVLYELESQLESRQWEIENGEPENPVHLNVLRAELPELARVCNMDAYDGDCSYASLSAYLQQAKSVLEERGNRTALAMDRRINDYIKENGQNSMSELKRDTYNLQLENLVLNRKTDKLYSVVGSHIVPRAGYVFVEPRSHNGRAPFYSGVKIVGNYEIETVWFNMAVLLLMCVVLGICLYTDCPGRFVRKERN